eukprot:Skav221593  [mRNA]  locus=scaffold1698:289440:290564:+ [translate_table: standard]
MTWQCGKCQLPNADTAEHCRSCKLHWSQIWHQSRRKRHGSQSRPRKEKEKGEKRDKKVPASSSKGGTKDKENKEQEPWHIFPSRVPWVATTPQSRVHAVKEQELVAEDRQLPPNPVLPAPPLPKPEAAPPTGHLSEDELETLKHFRALKDLGSLPEVLNAQMMELEQRQQQTATLKTLNHGHLNKLHRVRNQVQALVRRIGVVDEEWKSFIHEVTNKVHLHAQQFQAHRGDLLESLNTKLKELEAVKREVTTASQQLMGQVPTVDPQIEDVQLQEQLEQFHQLTSTLGMVPTPLVEVSEEEVDMEEDEELEPDTPREEKPAKTRSHLAPAPFRTAGSPGKVAQHNLKGKDKSKEKEKDKEKTKERAATAYRDDP